ncbi:MAG: hypothetical protein K8L97_17220 [Anaerolineae bacterium]|nr:hypothetical protein [Anaerolineae bacterium]
MNKESDPFTSVSRSLLEDPIGWMELKIYQLETGILLGNKELVEIVIKDISLVVGEINALNFKSFLESKLR